MIKREIIVFLMFFCCYCADSKAKNKIVLFSQNINDSTDLTRPTSVPITTAKDVTRLLMAALPQYLFSVEFAKTPSIARLLQKIPNSCAFNRVKNPKRLKENIYSLPVNIALGLQLYYKKGSRAGEQALSARNKDEQLLSLATLFTGKLNYTLGIDKGRSFSAFLDRQITALDSHNLVIIRGGGSPYSLVNMLLKNRIDYLIDYPIRVNKAQKKLQTTITLDSLEITGSPKHIIGHIACNKGPTGQKTIDDINNALQALYHNYEFYLAHIRYLNKADIADFNLAYQAVFNVDIPKERNLQE